MTNQSGELLQEHVEYKWIAAPDQHADHPGQTLLTRERAVICAWAEARGAEPATGVGKVDIKDGGAAIRFEFPGVGRLQPISWDDWFRNFDEYDLVFAYEEATEEGLQSHRYRLVRRETLQQYLADASAAAGEPRSGNAEDAPSPKPGEARSDAPRKRGLFRAFKLFGS